MKRVFDLLIAIPALVISLPLMIVLAILVKIDSPGPAFFRQVRIGRQGRPFRLLKFRSMRQADGAENGRFDAGSSMRVTRFGRILRKSKLDEIPQLLNILKGDMSLVGPRPEVRKWTEVYPERWRTVLQVRPGLTDRASIEFIDEERLLEESEDPEETYRSIILPQKLDAAEEYVRSRTMAGDLKVIGATALAVLCRPERAKYPAHES
ncbi:MAG: sugar transferase [Phycisphaera sp.]|nr:sugar transferase [Phycisphaera sp.]